jgi:solute carrier family 25 (mitochondrial citrate transporter), member 1
MSVDYSAGLQKATATPGTSALKRILFIIEDMWRNEGIRSFYKGITPRVLRVAPGQAIVFAVYEKVTSLIELMGSSVREEDRYSE